MKTKQLNEDGYRITTDDTQYCCANCEHFGFACGQDCCANGNALQLLINNVKKVNPSGACDKMFYVSKDLRSEPVISPVKKLVLNLIKFTYANKR